LHELRPRRGQVAAVVQLADDVAEHGHALGSVCSRATGGDFGARLGLFLDGVRQIAQKGVEVDRGDARRCPEGGKPTHRGPRQLVAQQLEMWVVADQEILEERVGREQVVDLGAG